MKKQLLCTSAIALGVAAAAPASAQDWNLDWGGYMSSHVAYVDTSGSVASATDFDGIANFNTGEIQFTPSVTLDNGLTFGVNVQLEAQNNVLGATNNIDESYITISGDTLGRVVLGAENSAGYTSMVSAPTVTSMYINSPSISAFVPVSSAVPFNFRQAGISSYTEVAGNNDVNRITYFTPSFNGLTVGISYARNNSGNAAQGFTGGIQDTDSSAATIEDIYDIGVNYSGTFGSTDVNIGARYGTGSAVAALTDDPETWGIGASVGFGDFTIGGSYAENDNANGAFGFDQSGWNLGATYAPAGAWSFEAVTYQGTYDDTSITDDSTYKAYRLGASRTLGAGVDWDIYAIYTEAEDEQPGGADLDGTIIGTAINLSF